MRSFLLQWKGNLRLIEWGVMLGAIVLLDIVVLVGLY